ncbi:hypothetical protein BHM03_00061473 [Ensete ventricosum]|nr:hypothetical protein BHM03_00061473 [Ensete ventricosum]
MVPHHFRYIPLLQETFSFPQSLGILGGKPGTSTYIVGVQEDKALYLDPHEVQPVCFASYEDRAVRFNEAPPRRSPELGRWALRASAWLISGNRTRLLSKSGSVKCALVGSIEPTNAHSYLKNYARSRLPTLACTVSLCPAVDDFFGCLRRWRFLPLPPP